MKSNIALQMFGEYLSNRNFSQNTLNRYSRDVRDFLLFTQKNDVREIGKEDILCYQKELHECGRYKKETQAGIIHTINHFFRVLTKHETILTNPFDSLDIGVIKREYKRDSVSADKLGKILDSINGNKYLDLRDRAVFEMMYGCGIRVGETVNLKMIDVDLRCGKIFVREGKGKKDRIVPLGKNALEYLKRYIEYGRNYLADIIDRDILFLSHNGRKLAVEDVEYSLKKRSKKVYPELHIYPHMLRHSFATHMLEAGAGIKHIKDILGHNSIETTVVYTHFNAVSMRKILKMYHPRENELYEEVDTEEFKKIFDIR